MFVLSKKKKKHPALRSNLQVVETAWIIGIWIPFIYKSVSNELSCSLTDLIID